MKRLLIIAGALFAFSVLTESCVASRSGGRPPVHPRPPRKFVKAPEAPVMAPVATPFVEKIG